MKFTYSNHWKYKKKSRKDITDDLIEYAIQNSDKSRDKYWEDAYNAICRIPTNGRKLKVIYKKQQMLIKIITAFWIG